MLKSSQMFRLAAFASWLIVVAAVLAGVATTARAGAIYTESRPPMDRVGLTYWTERQAAARSWSRLIHGTDRFRPRLIVEHWTGSDELEAAIDYWNSAPDQAFTHFMIDTDGTIIQIAALDVLAKHATGVAPWAIGIEHVGVRDAEVMANRAQRRASFRLTCWLRDRLRIPVRGVIGHGEVHASPRFTVTPEGWADLAAKGYAFPRGDFERPAMRRYRAALRVVC
jgi:hypothetical protein